MIYSQGRHIRPSLSGSRLRGVLANVVDNTNPLPSEHSFSISGDPPLVPMRERRAAEREASQEEDISLAVTLLEAPSPEVEVEVIDHVSNAVLELMNRRVYYVMFCNRNGPLHLKKKTRCMLNHRKLLSPPSVRPMIMHTVLFLKYSE